KATAPRFNLVLTYRRLHFHDLADKALENYKLIDAVSPWYGELTGGNSRDKSLLLDQLRLAVERNDIREAERLFQQDLDYFRQVLRQYGATNTEESPSVLHFIASEMEKRYGDKTFSALLAPLFTDHRQTIIALRQFVTEGAELFVKGDVAGSLRLYAKADQLAEQTGSLFDTLWIDLNRVDTQIRAGKFESAREALERIVSLSRKNGFRWLLGKGLSIYGSSKRLTASFKQMMDFVAEANHLFRNMDAHNDRIRPLYYSAIYQYGAGAQDEALKLALECLLLTDDRDSFRLAELEWLIGLILYNQGSSDKAALFERESLEQGQKISNAALQADAALTLAQLYESMSDHSRADAYLNLADQALHKMSAGFNQTKVDQWLSIVKAKIALNRKRYREAERLLERNLDINSQLPLMSTLPPS